MKPDDVNKGIQKRDPAVYEYLMEQYSRLLWVIAAGILNGTGNREDVEDLMMKPGCTLSAGKWMWR